MSIIRTNKKHILLLDLDDVLNTFNSDSTGWIKLYNDKYGLSHYRVYGKYLSTNEITEWDLHKFVLPGVNVFEEFIYNNNFFRSVGVQPYAQEATRELVRYFDVYVVSASHFSTVPDKAEWLVEHFPHIPIKHFIPCYNKFMIRGDTLLDDGIHNLVNFEGVRVLFDRPWNRQYQNNNSFLVMENWKSYNILF